MMRRIDKVIAFTILFCMNLAAVQQQEEKPAPAASGEKVRVIPGARYEAGWLHRLLFGSQWRDLWTTQMEVEVLDLSTFAGGLTPVRRSGGKQTKGLRLKGKNGREYKFRSIDKDPSLTLPPELQESIAVGILQDQISSANPLAPIVVEPFLDAVGVLHPEPRVFMMPDDEQLGEFREEYRGLLGTIEEHPEEGPDGQPGFAGADKVVDTYTLFSRLEEDNDERVDDRGYLTARLMDMYLGDWDRHVDQWRWARIEENRRKVWKPIPRDRDWAFARYNGLFPWIAAKAIPQIEPFSDDYPEIEDLTYSGRYVDRRLLVSLDKAAWDSVTTAVIEKLTDSLIEHAVHQLPTEMYAKGGDAMEKSLKSRRSKLRAASEDFYKLCSDYVNVRGSDKSEFAEINRLDEHRLEVGLFKRDKQASGKKGKPFFWRIFDDKYTKEVRLYLLGGDDIAVVEGDVNSSIEVRVIGGEGNDELVDRSNVKGYFLSVIPFIPDAETKTRFYDSGEDTKFTRGPSTTMSRELVKPPANDTTKYEPLLRDYGHDWKFGPWLSVGPDDGMFIGGGPVLYEFGFRADPYAYRMELRGGYATTPRKFRFDYTGEFFRLVKDGRIFIHAKASALEIRNFYGFGNETSRDRRLEDADYYKARQQQFLFHPTLEVPAFSKVQLVLGSLVKYTDTSPEDSTFLKLTQPYGVGKVSLFAVHGGFRVDTRDYRLVATRGVFLDVMGFYYPKVFNNGDQFIKGRADARAYFSGKVLTNATLALRVGGEKIWGDHPFYESSFIGGSQTIRGFKRERFAGDASVFGNAELRLFLSKAFILFRGEYGVLFLGDVGKVFVSGVRSDRWHGAVGGGIWYSLSKRDYTLSISVAQSRELTGVYLAGGFMF